MIKKYENKSLLLNADIANKKAGSVVKIKVDQNGVPVERYWRDRIKDSKLDKCVTIISDNKAKEILAGQSNASGKAAPAKTKADTKTKAK